MREAFKEWGESAVGIDGPIVIPTRPPLWVRVIRWLFNR